MCSFACENHMFFFFFNCNDKSGRKFIKNAFALPILPLQLKTVCAFHMQMNNIIFIDWVRGSYLNIIATWYVSKFGINPP